MRAGYPQQLVAPTRQFAQGDAPQQVVKARDGLLAAWVPHPKLLDPPS